MASCLIGTKAITKTYVDSLSARPPTIQTSKIQIDIGRILVRKLLILLFLLFILLLLLPTANLLNRTQLTVAIYLIVA